MDPEEAYQKQTGRTGIGLGWHTAAYVEWLEGERLMYMQRALYAEIELMDRAKKESER